MSAESRAAVAAAQAGNMDVHVSPMTAWGNRHTRRRKPAPADAFSGGMVRCSARVGARLAALPPMVLAASASLPGSPPKDPVDRIIAATGRVFGSTVITHDGELRRYAEAGHLEWVPC
jgi:PIN domain nuclease of toxin-antitoxin system